MTSLYNMQGQRLQTESIRYVEWAGAQKYVRYIHEDIMGSSIYYTNPETGYITNKHEYTTWGNNTKAPTYNYDPEYRVSEPYFTGHPYDGSLNLYYAENRFYDPETGSFLSSDPVQSGLNWYQYCGSNPTTYVDPLGLFATTIAEDDPFFFRKMQDSGEQNDELKNLLEKVDSVTKDQLQNAAMVRNHQWTEQQLLTAKYLTLFLLNDQNFSKEAYAKEMMYAVVGNMFVEAYPAKTEQYSGNGSDEKYMKNTLKNTEYRQITETYKGYANNMTAINALAGMKNVDDGNRQGFGFGMLQYTFGRATTVMEMYQKNYGDTQEGELTFGQCFAAEYQLLQHELSGNGEYGFQNLVGKTKFGNQDFENRANTLGVEFRNTYENPKDGSEAAGGINAEEWYKMIGIK